MRTFPASEAPSRERGGFGLTLVLIGVIFGILSVLLLCQANSATSLGRERKLASLGLEAQVGCNNALQEAFFHFMTRSNSPKLSKKDKTVDLYYDLRDYDIGKKIEYEIPAVMARRLFHPVHGKISKVRVKILVTNVDKSPPKEQVTYQPIWTPYPGWTPPPGWVPPPGFTQRRIVDPGTSQTPGTATGQRAQGESPAVGGGSAWALPPGGTTGSSWCNVAQVRFIPRIVAVGMAQFYVQCKVKGPYNCVHRRTLTRKAFTVLEVSSTRQIYVVRLTPNNIFTKTQRLVRPVGDFDKKAGWDS